MMKFSALKTFILLLLISLSSLQAEELVYHIDPNFNACATSNQNPAVKYNQSNVKINYADFKYDTVSKLFQVEVEFTNAGGGTLANGFHFGLNSEASLINNRFKLAYFYVDGTKLKSSSPVKIPTVTAYIYNREEQAGNSSCNNAPGSWQTNPGGDLNRTEPILLSDTPNTNPDWVQLAEMSENETVTTRKFTIIIDAAPIQAFVPNNTADFQQEMAVSCKYNNTCLSYNNLTKIFDFGAVVSGVKRLTLDFIPSVITSSTYLANNQISSFNLSTCSLCRVVYQKPNTAPLCSGVSGIADEIGVGESVAANVNFSDPDTTDQHKVEFSGANKAGMQFVSGTTAVTNNSVLPTASRSVTFKWTPTASDIGSYSIPVRFQQLYGENGSYTSPTNCTLNFNVVQGVNSPICETNDLTTRLQQISTQLNDLKSLLLARNRNNQRYAPTIKLKKRQDFSTKIFNYSKTIEDYLAVIPRSFVTCTSGFGSCRQDSYEDQLFNSRKDIPLLFCDGRELTACNFIDNVGLKLLKVWRKNQIIYHRERGTLTADMSARITRKFKNSKKKATNLSLNSFNGVEQLINDKFTINFVCN